MELPQSNTLGRQDCQFNMRAIRNWSIPIGKVLGVQFQIHWTYAILWLYFLLTALDPGKILNPVKGMLAFLLITAAALWHELGHLLAANVRSVAPHAVVLFPFGGIPMSEDGAGKKTPAFRDEVLVSLSGPAANLLVAAIAALLAKQLHPEMPLFGTSNILAGTVSHMVLWINVLLGAMNFFPVYPLDGGRILRAFLAHNNEDATQDYAAATRRVVAISQIFVMFLFVVGMLKMVSWVMLVAFFLFVAVQQEDRSLIFQLVTENVRIEEVMLTNFATLSPADTLQDALEKAVHCLQDDFPVIRSGDLVGVISKQNIIRALRDDGDGYVQSAMKKVALVASRQESLANAFKKITAQSASLIPVVDDDRLVGIVTLQNLMHSMGLLAESRKLQRDLE